MRCRRIAARCRHWRASRPAFRQRLRLPGHGHVGADPGVQERSTAAVLPIPRRNRWPCHSTTTTSRCWQADCGASRAFDAGLAVQGGSVDIEQAPVQLETLISASFGLGGGVLSVRRLRWLPARARLPAGRPLPRRKAGGGGGTSARRRQRRRQAKPGQQTAASKISADRACNALEIITQPACQRPDDAVPTRAKLWRAGQCHRVAAILQNDRNRPRFRT